MNSGQIQAKRSEPHVFAIEPHHIPVVDFSKPGWDMPVRVAGVLRQLARTQSLAHVLSVYGKTTVDAALERIGHPPSVKIPFCLPRTRAVPVPL